MFLATHGGHNAESHNHNDVGDFILYANGAPVIIDAGRGNYTARTFSSQRYELWFTQSDYHNLPIVNGFGQKAGRAFAAQDARSTISDRAASLSADIAAAYPPEAGITSWNRVVALDRVRSRVEITDDYVLTQKPNSLQQIFMTIAEVDVTKPGEVLLTTPQGQRFTIGYDAKKWRATTEFPSTEGMEYKSFKTKWGGHRVQRIVLTGQNLKAKDKVQFVISK